MAEQDLPIVLEARFAAVKSINEPVDWSKGLEGHPDTVEARKVANEMFARLGEPGRNGHAMRGLALAIADQFPEKFLSRGMSTTLRGVRNAFAHRVDEIVREIQREGKA